MNTDEKKWAPTPRQYRPTYTHLPSSTSMSNFGSPVKPTVCQPPLSYQRCRIMSTFPAMDLLHSAPTVASSCFTASVSSDDISHPTPKQHRLSLQTRNRKSTRIPTPTSGAKSSSQIRVISSPALSHKLKEVRYNPVFVDFSLTRGAQDVTTTTHRLLGPIQPGPAPTGTLSKSRTMSVLSSFATPFTHTLTSSRASFGNLSAHIISNSSAFLPLPTFTTNILQINTSMPSSYWLGRFQALHDHFRAENLSQDFLDSPIARQWMYNTDGNPTAGDENDSARKYEERLSKRCFTHLEALCMNNEAKKSLKVFQQAFARKVDCEALLPVGGSMADKESGLIAKAGRLFSGGRKSSFGMIGRKRSMLGLGTVDANIMLG